MLALSGYAGVARAEVGVVALAIGLATCAHDSVMLADAVCANNACAGVAVIALIVTAASGYAISRLRMGTWAAKALIERAIVAIVTRGVVGATRGAAGRGHMRATAGHA